MSSSVHRLKEVLPNIRIVSDGTLPGTSVQTMDGQEIGFVRSIKWEMSVDDMVATVTVEFVKIPVELVGEAKIKLNRQIEAEKKKLGAPLEEGSL